jgi:hypothetical protein
MNADREFNGLSPEIAMILCKGIVYSDIAQQSRDYMRQINRLRGAKTGFTPTDADAQIIEELEYCISH